MYTHRSVPVQLLPEKFFPAPDRNKYRDSQPGITLPPPHKTRTTQRHATHTHAHTERKRWEECFTFWLFLIGSFHGWPYITQINHTEAHSYL